MQRFKMIRAIAICAVMLGLTPGLQAQETDPGPPPEQMEPLPPPEVSEAQSVEAARFNIENHGAFEAFVDGLVKGYMEKDHIAGATVSIVKDGQLVLAKGYGISDAGPKRPVDPAVTLFRVGSISKTFTWTALMQLAEAGKLSIDDPVNDHLPASLQVTDQGFDEPIRIRHLMTHTPGFEEAALGHLFAKGPEDAKPLLRYLETYRPTRVRPAGEMSSYSNYGAGLGGVIVSHVSGQVFEDYIDDHILGPLGMTRTTFREPFGDAWNDSFPRPMSDDLARDVSAGFEWKDGGWKTKDFEFITQVGPAGAVSATATDMARYMIAHLHNGAIDDARILEDQTAEEMHQRLYSNAEAVNGLAHGFLEYAMPGGLRSYGHGGATLYFQSNMVMVPELDLGIFISTNTGSGFSLVYALPVEIVGRFFTGEDPRTLEPPADFAERGQRFAGTYLNNRRSYTQLEKLLQVAVGFATVSVTEDGYLLVTAGGQTTRYVETGPLTFSEVEGLSTIAFRENQDGDVDRLITAFGISAGERVGFFAGPQWFSMIVGLTLISAIGCITGWWLRRKRAIEQSKHERLSGHLMGGLGLAWLVFVGLIGIAIAKLASLGTDAMFAFPSSTLVLSLWAALLCAVGTVAALASLYPVWNDGHWPLWRRIRHSLAVAISFGFTLTLYGWNVLGFKYF